MKEYTNSQMRLLIEEYIHNERDRAILLRRLCDGLTFEALAFEFNLSDRQIKNIVYKGMNILIRHL